MPGIYPYPDVGGIPPDDRSIGARATRNRILGYDPDIEDGPRRIPETFIEPIYIPHDYEGGRFSRIGFSRIEMIRGCSALCCCAGLIGIVAYGLFGLRSYDYISD